MAAAVLAAGSAAVWRGPGELRGAAAGLLAAWLVSTVSSTALIAANSLEPLSRRVRAFWWAFGLGAAMRLAVLIALMAVSAGGPVSAPALLLAYAFGVLFLLILEYRQIKLPAPRERST